MRVLLLDHDPFEALSIQRHLGAAHELRAVGSPTELQRHVERSAWNADLLLVHLDDLAAEDRLLMPALLYSGRSMPVVLRHRHRRELLGEDLGTIAGLLLAVAECRQDVGYSPVGPRNVGTRDRYAEEGRPAVAQGKYTIKETLLGEQRASLCRPQADSINIAPLRPRVHKAVLSTLGFLMPEGTEAFLVAVLTFRHMVCRMARTVVRLFDRRSRS